ncbi:MAG TPA: hypothetical protein V6C81_32370 [Planktothrix sp.]
MTEEPNTAKDAAETEQPSAAPVSEPATDTPKLVTPDANSTAPKATAPPAATTTSAAPSEEGSIVQRRSRWYSSLAALKYISSLSRDDDVKVRDSDRATSISLLIASVLTVLSLLFPPLAPHRLALVLICDALVGLMLLFYVANRFGILNTFSPRQALLSWQLMMGAGFLGIFATINLAVAIALIVAQMNIDVPHP